MKDHHKRMKTLATVAGVAAAGSTAQAAVIYYDIADVSVSVNEYLLLNVKNGTTAKDGALAGADFKIDFDGGNAEKPQIHGEAANAELALDGVQIAKFDLNDTIDSSLTFSTGSYFENQGSGPWNGGATNKYTGFQLNTGTLSNMFGWIRMDYDDDNASITVKDFAYDDSGSAILAGASTQAVPEPASATLILVAGSVIYGLRRLRKKYYPA